MTTISIRHNFPEVIAAMDRVGKDIGDIAMVRALNTTIGQGRTDMARAISKEFRISTTKAKERLSIQRATAGRGGPRFHVFLEATGRGRGRSANLIAFVSGASRPQPWSGKQLKLKIKRGGGAKTITGAFIGNQGRTVFIRRRIGYIGDRVNRKGNSKHAESIQALNTIDIPQMFNTKRINFAVRKVMLQKFEKNFARELRAVLGGFAR